MSSGPWRRSAKDAQPLARHSGRFTLNPQLTPAGRMYNSPTSHSKLMGSTAHFAILMGTLTPSGPGQPPAKDCAEPAERLLDCLGLKNPEVKRVRVKSVCLEIDLKDEKGCKDC